jgi:hypothetical protein
VSESSLHPADWMLELYAEGELQPDEAVETEAHVTACGRCRAEVDAFRMLFAELGQVSRFAPGPEFSEAVMARVKITPPPRLEVWLQRWLPRTPRAWALALGIVAVPAAPVIALLAWVLSWPTGAKTSLAGDAARWAGEQIWSFVLGVAHWVIETSAGEYARAALAAIGGMSTVYLAATAILLGVGILLSAWALVRLVRTPHGEMIHAN